MDFKWFLQHIHALFTHVYRLACRPFGIRPCHSSPTIKLLSPWTCDVFVWLETRSLHLNSSGASKQLFLLLAEPCKEIIIKKLITEHEVWMMITRNHALFVLLLFTFPQTMIFDILSRYLFCSYHKQSILMMIFVFCLVFVELVASHFKDKRRISFHHSFSRTSVKHTHNISLSFRPFSCRIRRNSRFWCGCFDGKFEEVERQQLAAWRRNGV